MKALSNYRRSDFQGSPLGNNSVTRSYLIGGGIGSMAAAAFMIRDGGVPGDELLGIDREIPPVTRHDKTLRVQFEALIKAFK